MDKSKVLMLLSKTDDIEQRTLIFVEWMKSQTDDVKRWYAINWNIPHSLFNISCKFFDKDQIQNINWFKIYKSKKPLGYWKNGNQITA